MILVTGPTGNTGKQVLDGLRARGIPVRAMLRSQASFAAVPFAGGISVATKQAQQQNTDRVPPAFSVDTHESGAASGLSDE